MPEIIRFDSAHGGSVLIETAGGPAKVRDVSSRTAFRTAEEKFETVLGKVRALSDLVAHELGELASSPDEVSVELGVNVTAGADIMLVKANAESTMKITLTWRKGEKGAAGPPEVPGTP
ncbi:CU044_2847 family protein [Marinactinospora thermotolerans]|uniref:Trypsin-co-occurring domain-containing protein n=1 Tax=Marinactinospora thermotolerans DSM 45154 TaxID=1122192 RepID=A0A1T4KU83_9ACTN|nr:CU044_2847 family protein [Marinactinospora thermotolerans]SJZ45981.1 hypothetical protein SAMN02745673_00541 [Marinactinospora thermotolerans DSM 45154]